MTYALLAISCLVLCVVSTLTLSLREVSFSRLSRRLTANGRAHWLVSYREHLDTYLFGAATMRTMMILVVVLAIARLCRTQLDPDGPLSIDAVLFTIGLLLLSICGVAIPEALARYAGDGLLSSLLGLPMARAAAAVAWPLRQVQRVVDIVIRRLAGVPENDQTLETQQIERDVLEAVEDAELQGVVDRAERDMIKSVMELDEATAEQIMTPRTEVIGADKSTTLADLKALIKKEGHSRIPVYEETIDRVLGLVYAKDLLHVQDDDTFDLRNHLRAVAFVPQSKDVRDLLAEFKSGKTHVAIVLDEYGGTAGLVTIEDILEELVGEIADEFEPPEPEPILRVDDRVLEVDSRVHVDEINELLHVRLPEEDDYDTIGGYVFATLGKIPVSGEELTHDGVRITILEAEDRRIKRLRIEPLTVER